MTMAERTAYVVLLGEVENTIIHESYDGAVADFVDSMIDYVEQRVDAEPERYKTVLEEVEKAGTEQEKVNLLVDLGIEDDFLHVGILELPIYYDLFSYISLTGKRKKEKETVE